MSSEKDHKTPEGIENSLTLQQLFNQLGRNILQRKVKNKPLVVGINGIDASGKTNFTCSLTGTPKARHLVFHLSH